VLKLAEQFRNVLYVVPAIAQTKRPAEAREVARAAAVQSLCSNLLSSSRLLAIDQ
jgi:hypothetical protein